jgi:hypothetical protein
MNHETYDIWFSTNNNTIAVIYKIGNEFSELYHFQQIFVDIP